MLSATFTRLSLTLGNLTVHDCGSGVSDERGTLSFGTTSSHMRLSLRQSSIVAIQDCLRSQRSIASTLLDPLSEVLLRAVHPVLPAFRSRRILAASGLLLLASLFPHFLDASALFVLTSVVLVLVLVIVQGLVLQFAAVRFCHGLRLGSFEASTDSSLQGPC